MTTDVGIVVGIIADDSGARVIKRSLDDVAVANKKVEDTTKAVGAAAIRASIAEKAFAADTQKVNAATVAAAAAQGKAENAMRSAAIGAEKLAEAEKRLGLEAQKTATATANAAAAQQRAENAMLSAAQQAKKLSDQQARLTDEIKKTNSILEAGKNLIATYFGIQAAKSLRDTAMSAEALRYRMSAAVGSFGDAGDALKFVHDESQRLGLSFKDTAGSFAGFSASALRAGLSMQDVKDIFTGTSEAIRALKLNEQQANSVFLALEQMAGKGTVQMQELKLQLGAALPGAIEIFATAMGKTPQQFYKMVEAGEVTTDSLKTMGRAFHDEFGVAAVEASHSAAAETARFNNTVFELGDTVGNSTGLMTAYKDSLGGLSKGFSDTGNLADILRAAVLSLRDVFDTLAISIGTAFSLVINAVKENINGALELLNGLKEGSNRYLGTNFQQSTMLSTTSAMDIVNGGSDTLNAAYQHNLNAYRASKNYDAVADKSDPAKQAGAAAQAAQAQADARASAAAKADKKAEAERRRQEAEAKRAAAPGLKAEKEAAREQKKQQDELQAAINGSRTEAEKLNDELARLQSLKTGATVQQIDLLNRGIRNTQGEIDKLALKAELDSPLAKGFAAVADEVQDKFKDAFKGAFDGGGSLFKKFADGIKATFKSLLLDLAYQAAVKPIVVSVLGGIGGSLGLSGSALSSVLGTGGAPGAGGVAGAASNGLSLASLGSSVFGAGKALLSGGSITGGLGQFAGKASAALGGSFSTNVGVQKFFTNAGSFGNIAGGLAGGLGANLLGLGNKNGLISGAGGTIGGLIGSVGGPLGAAAGSFLGTALTGLFGGAKPSDKAQWGGINLADLTNFGTGGLSGKKYSDENAKFRDGVLGNAGQLAQLLKGAGGSTSGSLFVTVGNRDGLRLGTGSTEQNFGTNQQAFINAVMKQVTDSTTGLNATMKQILDKTGTGDLNALAGNFEFGKAYDQLGKVADPLGDALTALNSQFDAMRQTANNLGFPLEKINTEYAKQKQAVEENIKAQQAGFSSFADLTKAFDGFFNSQALGDNSSLNPLQKLGVAQSDFGGLLSKAQGGDLSVTQDLLSSANTLLGLGRDTYASGADFTGLESFVKSSVSSVAKQSGYTGNPVVSAIQQGNDTIVNVLLKILESTNKAAADSFRAANKAAVAA
ncbi:MAG: tape measure protein [Janthinobacterium lividum]